MMGRKSSTRHGDMAKGNPLQEQLLKAGLVKKSKLAEVAREQNKARHGKGPSGIGEIQLEAERARAAKAERDRALAAERKAQSRIAELRAQARQIIEDKKVPRSGEIEYRFTADGVIRTLVVNEDLRQKLSSGALVIVRLGDRYELLPRAAGDRVRERDASMIVLDHGQDMGTGSSAVTTDDDAYYAQFRVPDDLAW
jgi:uncharacterized protein YaiL (DUF2058 family)